MADIVFRVDANSEIATGHFMRCLSIADALYRHNFKILFIAQTLSDSLLGILKDRGYKFVAINTLSGMGIHSFKKEINNIWSQQAQEKDAKETIKILNQKICKMMFVDHYFLSQPWEKTIRPYAEKLIVIDDLADRIHHCDILMDDNLMPGMKNRYEGMVDGECRLLLGPQFSVFREEFLRYRDIGIKRNKPAKNILISFGGVDADNLTEFVIKSLLFTGIEDKKIEVVMGGSNPNARRIRNQYIHKNINFHVQTDKMALLMANADLAIGAAGHTAYEYAAMSLPSILIPMSALQASFSKEMDAYGATITFDLKESSSLEGVGDFIDQIADDVVALERMSQASRGLIDGCGVERLTNILIDHHEH